MGIKSDILFVNEALGMQILLKLEKNYFSHDRFIKIK